MVLLVFALCCLLTRAVVLVVGEETKDNSQILNVFTTGKLVLKLHPKPVESFGGQKVVRRSECGSTFLGFDRVVCG